MVGKLRVLLVTTAPGAAERVLNSLRGSGIVCTVERCTAPEEAAGFLAGVRLSESRYTLVLVDAALPDGQAQRAVNSAVRADPDCPVIVFGEGLDGQAITASLVAGARDVVPAEDLPRLADVIEPLVVPWPERVGDERLTHWYWQDAGEVQWMLWRMEERVFVKDEQMRFIYANDLFASDRTTTPAQIVGKSDNDFFNQERAELYQAEDRRILESGEAIFPDRDSGDFDNPYSTWTKIPIKDGQGKPVAVLGLSGGIFQRRSYAEKLSHWASMVPSSPDAIMRLSPSGIIASWDGAAEAMYGYRADEMIGRSITHLVPEEARPALLERLARLRGRRSVALWEAEAVTRKGSRLDFSLSLSPIVSAVGLLVAISAVARDITRQKEAERRLRESEERFRAVVENASDGVSVCRWDTARNRRTLVLCNDRFVEMAGRTRRELESAQDLNQLRSLHGPEDEDKERRVRMLEGLPVKGTASWKRHDGKANVFEFSAVCVIVGGERHLMSVDRDITERVQAEMRERELTEELKRSNRDLSEFAHTVSHDLKEPLRKVGTFGRYLQEDFAKGLSDDGRDYLKRMTDSVARMQHLIEHLLALCSVGTEGAEIVPTDSGDVARQAIENLGGQAAEAGGTVTVRDPLPVVMADPVQLGQVFQNLVGNALKFRTPGRAPVVEVAATEQDGEAHFTVSDNGIGIEERFLEKVFGLFLRLHTREEYEGSGIGLALCRKIVERHRGRIWVESEFGKSTTIHFTLPLAVAR